MIKFLAVVVAFLSLSLAMNYMALGYQKEYNIYIQHPDNKNTAIYPFYELWVYLGLIIITIIVIATITYNIKNKHSN